MKEKNHRGPCEMNSIEGSTRKQQDETPFTHGVAGWLYFKSFPGARFSKVLILFGRISGDNSLFFKKKASRRRHETLQLLWFLSPSQHIKRPALQKKRVGVLRMAFRNRKVFGTFEKRTLVVIDMPCPTSTKIVNWLGQRTICFLFNYLIFCIKITYCHYRCYSHYLYYYYYYYYYFVRHAKFSMKLEFSFLVRL